MGRKEVNTERTIASGDAGWKILEIQHLRKLKRETNSV